MTNLGGLERLSPRRPGHTPGRTHARDLRGFRLQKVSRSGQVTLPGAARSKFGVRNGGYVDVVRTSRVLVVKRTLDRYGMAETSPIRKAPAVPNLIPSAKRYTVSRIGQISIPASTRREWGLQRGGSVEVAWVDPLVLILPQDGPTAILRDWLAPPASPPGPTELISPPPEIAKREGPTAHASQVLLAGGLVERLVCGLPLPPPANAANVAIGFAEYVSFASSAVARCNERPLPAPLSELSHISLSLGREGWLSLLLDLTRLRDLSRNAVALSHLNEAGAAEAVVLAGRWSIDVALAANLVLARTQGLPLLRTSDPDRPLPSKALAELGLTRTPMAAIPPPPA
jgi:bifunctional DNA-binding transcriptional regulator/antitoxin component of YhaV-PrlF toxin-antitoxin module